MKKIEFENKYFEKAKTQKKSDVHLIVEAFYEKYYGNSSVQLLSDTFPYPRAAKRAKSLLEATGGSLEDALEVIRVGIVTKTFYFPKD